MSSSPWASRLSRAPTRAPFRSPRRLKTPHSCSAPRVREGRGPSAPTSPWRWHPEWTAAATSSGKPMPCSAEPIGGVGQRMLGGVAKRIAKKFFADIDAAIRDGVPVADEATAGAAPPAEGAGVAAAGTGAGAGASAPVTAAAAAPGKAAAPVASCATGDSRRCSDGFLAGAAVGAGAALLGVCLGLLGGRR